MVQLLEDDEWRAMGVERILAISQKLCILLPRRRQKHVGWPSPNCRPPICDSKNPTNHTFIEKKDKPVTVWKLTRSEYKQALSLDEVSKEFQTVKDASNSYDFDEDDDEFLCLCGETLQL